MRVRGDDVWESEAGGQRMEMRAAGERDEWWREKKKRKWMKVTESAVPPQRCLWKTGEILCVRQ